jgi:ABC-type transporter Mla subunit MlaD
MIFGKTKLELKVGVFVFLGMVILAIFVLSIGGIKTWSSGQNIHCTFGFINGVKLGAPVRFAGLDVGRVTAINICLDGTKDSVTKLEVICWVKKEVRIPQDSTVWVNTLGLLGEKYIEIMPGKDYSVLLADNAVIRGEDPVPIHELGELVKRIADDLDLAITKIMNKEGTIGKLLFDDALYNDLREAINNKTGTVGRLLYDDTLYKETQDLIRDIKKHPWKLFFKTKER